MKKIVLIILLITLTGCQKDLKELSYTEKADVLTLSYFNGSAESIVDRDVINTLYDIIANQPLEVSKEAVVMENYMIDFFGEPIITIIDGVTLNVDGKNYKLQNSVKNDIELILENYLKFKGDDTVIVDLDHDNINTGTQDETFAGRLNNGDSVHFISVGTYFNKRLVKNIFLNQPSGTKNILKGQMTVPVMSPDGNKFAFVDGVGFELTGHLYVYENDQLNEIVSEEMTEKLTDNRTIKACEWYNNNTLFLILGFDSGTITQGGDLYTLNLNNSDLKMILDAKEGKEIVGVEFKEGLLSYDVLTWTDDNYLTYSYDRRTIRLEDYLDQLPMIIE